MKNLRDLKKEIEKNPKYWFILLMDFVDDFRRQRDISALKIPFRGPHNRWSALLAATAESLCAETNAIPPTWLAKVAACKTPWFVAGLESLKAITLAESPLPFRLRKIFVQHNFLSRV
jgi:hypothetical protein